MVEQNVNLKEHNTFGINVNCSAFSEFTSQAELANLLKNNQQETLILGGGSNLLFTKDFDGLVLKNSIKGINIIKETSDHAFVKVGAGEIWHEFVLFCIENNLGGVENLSLIPGSVGASPMQNIGAYGVEIKDVFQELSAYLVEQDEVRVFEKEECAFGYRESIFKKELKNKAVILDVTYRLTKQPNVNTSYGAIEAELAKHKISNPTIKNVSDAVISIRQSKLPNPKEIGNAGSFFKNPVVDTSVLEEIQKNHPNVPNYPASDNKVKLAAGWLIEQAGWKGKTFENYGVHKNQALVLVNYSDALGKNIYDLSTNILKDVQKKFGVTLEREVNIM